jgi:VCBS repeat-containing protein
VTIRANHAATNQSRASLTSSAGTYSLPLLPSGDYQVTAEKEGFKRFSRAGIALRINDNVELNITLEVGGVSETVTVTVDPVNDAPSFTKGADQTVLEDASAQSISGWATSLSKGPSDESGQTLSFNVTGNTNAGLFAAAPAMA